MVRRSSRSRSRGRPELYQAGEVKSPKTPRAAKTPKSPPPKEPSMQFEVGDGVMAKWPGSKLFYNAKVQLIRPDENEYDVEYENGTVFTIDAKDVIKPNTSSFKKAARSARSKSKSRARSAGRKKNPKASPKKPLVDDTYGDTTVEESFAEETVAKKASNSSRVSRRSGAASKLSTSSRASTKAVTDAFSEDDSEDVPILSVSARPSNSSRAASSSELELLAADQTTSARASMSSRISSMIFGASTPAKSPSASSKLQTPDTTDLDDEAEIKQNGAANGSARTSGASRQVSSSSRLSRRSGAESKLGRSSRASNKAATDLFSEDEEDVGMLSVSARASRSSVVAPANDTELELLATDQTQLTEDVAPEVRTSISSRISSLIFGSSTPPKSTSISSSVNSPDLEVVTDDESAVISSAKASASSKKASTSFKKASTSSRLSTKVSASSEDLEKAPIDITEEIDMGEKEPTIDKTSISSKISSIVFGEASKASTSSKASNKGATENEDVIQDLAAAEVNSFPFMSARRSSRASTRASTIATKSAIRQSTEARRSVGLDEFSEDEDGGKKEAPAEEAADEEKVETVSSTSSSWSTEWLWAVFFMALCPAILVSLHTICTGQICSLAMPTLSLDPRDYIDYEAVGMLLSFVTLLRVLEFICMGKEVQGYRMNGFQSLILVLLLVPVLVNHGVSLSPITAKYFHLMCGAILLSYAQALFSLLLSWGSDPLALSSKGNTSNPLVNLYHGRQLNPSLLGANLKLQTFRCSMIGLALLNTLLVTDAALSKGAVNPTVVIAATFQILYALDAMYYEDCYFYSHDSLYSGYGWSLISSYLTFPFLPTLVTRYMVATSPTLSWPALAGIAAMNLLGYYIYRSSESQRCQLARDPSHPSLAHLATLEGPKGRRLIVSGWWGMVRHPNYLGELLVQWSWLLPAAPSLGATQLVPYYLPVVTSLMLILRCVQINKRNSRKFGEAWTQYTDRVRANIVPCVF